MKPELQRRAAAHHRCRVADAGRRRLRAGWWADADGRRGAGWWQGAGGFTLIEVMVALCIAVSGSMLALSAGATMLRFVHAVRAEAAGLAAGQAKVEELISLVRARRAEGHDVVDLAGVEITRIWRVRTHPDLPGLQRIEVSSRWDQPELTVLLLVAVAP
jgi:prepilin-type N-terminal cleavage/methylation domain-containing protein